MPFTRDNTILPGVNEDTVKQSILKLDDDMSKIYTHANTVNTLTSQKISQTEKGSPNGVAPLDNNSDVPLENIPDTAKPPVGSVTMFAGETAPSGWFECNGATYVITDYPKLFDAIGYLWGGTGLNFKIPDMRGYFPRGWDHSAGVDPDRAARSGGDHVGSTQADSVGPHNHNLDVGGQYVAEGGAWAYGDREHGEAMSSSIVQNYVSNETRPKNKYFMFIIKHD
ncbi:phage tail protein [Fundidesulfovibrio putealis]|uniref:phage tail protein n=1 Tax=Fundidesulfovibrio putealis TaxID=270496 RepID=UPI000A04BD2E|nr:phage tail protein [Fundidesulfovibrio putealis]